MIAGLLVCHLPTKSSPSRPTTVLPDLIMSRIKSREGKEGLCCTPVLSLICHQHKIQISFLYIVSLLLARCTRSQSCMRALGYIHIPSLTESLTKLKNNNNYINYCRLMGYNEYQKDEFNSILAVSRCLNKTEPEIHSSCGHSHANPCIL